MTDEIRAFIDACEGEGVKVKELTTKKLVVEAGEDFLLDGLKAITPYIRNAGFFPKDCHKVADSEYCIHFVDNADEE